MNLYTIDICPVCGATFNKHINARYCSLRCSRKAGRQRRYERYAGPTIPDPHAANPHRVDYLGTRPIEHTVLRHLSLQIRDAYRGKVDKRGRTIHGGGELLYYDFSPEAIGTFTPEDPVMLHEKPRLTDEEPRIITMAHREFFGIEPPPSVPDPNFDPANIK